MQAVLDRALNAKNVAEKNRELERKIQQLEEKNRQLEEKNRQLEDAEEPSEDARESGPWASRPLAGPPRARGVSLILCDRRTPRAPP
jgi:hypothetical protein